MTKRLKIGLGAALAVLLGGSAVVYAHEAGEHGPMAKFDADGNGTITRGEARAGAADMFAQADADKNGRVTMEEMRAFHGRMGGHRGGPPPGDPDGPRPDHGIPLDADGDGSVTLAEAQDGVERHLAAIDSNHDGAVSGDEMRAAHEAHRGHGR